MTIGSSRESQNTEKSDQVLFPVVVMLALYFMPES